LLILRGWVLHFCTDDELSSEEEEDLKDNTGSASKLKTRGKRTQPIKKQKVLPVSRGEEAFDPSQPSTSAQASGMPALNSPNLDQPSTSAQASGMPALNLPNLENIPADATPPAPLLSPESPLSVIIYIDGSSDGSSLTPSSLSDVSDGSSSILPDNTPSNSDTAGSGRGGGPERNADSEPSPKHLPLEDIDSPEEPFDD